MASDDLYETCLSLLQDPALEEEDKTDKLEELVRQETTLTGKALENVLLDILWKHKNAGSTAPFESMRLTVVRRDSPAHWHASRSGTPAVPSPRSSAVSPVSTPLLAARPPLRSMKSSAISPFTSPRASPRLAYASPQLAYTRPNSFENDDKKGSSDTAEDSTMDNFDWLIDDDTIGNPSSGHPADSSNESVTDWGLQASVEMSPYDILRHILRGEKSDREIVEILEANAYDLSAALASLTRGGIANRDQASLRQFEQNKTILVGKSMNPEPRSLTPIDQAKSGIVCKYWLSTGECLRADCRFSHDLANHVCKYWLAGSCLAGDSCMFSHDPSSLLSNMSLEEAPYNTPSDLSSLEPTFQLHDYSTFPTLKSAPTEFSRSGSHTSLRDLCNANSSTVPPPVFTIRAGLAPEFVPRSFSQSIQQVSMKPSKISVEDSEAFPTLGSDAAKGPRKHHGKRGHGHSNKDREPASLADVVRSAPMPEYSPPLNLGKKGNLPGSRESHSDTNSIPAPERIPWLETGDCANKAYLKARQDAIKHGGARNKFLQSAAQAWNRNDVRAAKALSLRGQSENDLMREAHRAAARCLFEDRNSATLPNNEIYVDLHGLHPAEAILYLSSALGKQVSQRALHRDASRYLYAIVGTGHHSKNGRDKVGKAIRLYLGQGRYIFREFSVPGDRLGNGGILGIDISSGTSSTAKEVDNTSANIERGSPMQGGKIRILKAGDINGISL